MKKLHGVALIIPVTDSLGVDMESHNTISNTLSTMTIISRHGDSADINI